MNENQQSGWFVVMTTALRQTWIGWPGPLVLFGFCVFLSVNVFLLAYDPEMNVLSQAKMVNLTIQEIVLSGTVMALLSGANAFSGERDRQTLESLLLTPTSRGQIATGKLLAVLSLWIGMVPLAIPYILLVNSGTNLFEESLLTLVVVGTCVVALAAGIGVLVSGLAPTNMASFAVSFVILGVLVIPTQLPGQVQDLPGVNWFIVSNPVTSAAKYQNAVIVDGEPWMESLGLLVSPIVGLLLVVGAGTAFLDRNLVLHGGVATRPVPRKPTTVIFAVVLVLGLLLSATAQTVQGQGTSSNGSLTVSLSRETASLVAGDWTDFDTQLTNSGSDATPMLVAHLSVASQKKGPHVDPEDWSDERTQFLPGLGPGESVTLHWGLHGLFEGNFVVFVTVFSPEQSFTPVMSLPLYVHIEPDEILVLENVIPVVAVVPLVPLAYLLFAVNRMRKRRLS